MMMRAPGGGSSSSPLVVNYVAAFALGAAVVEAARWMRQRTSQRVNRRSRLDAAHKVVWDAINGAMSASQIYLGDRLGLYVALRELGATTPAKLAAKTALNPRWLREWLAQQAAMGILSLQDEETFEFADAETAEVLADPESTEYDVALVQFVPSLVHRAKAVLPEAFKTGLGVPYDDDDVSAAIDRAHSKHVRDVFLPKVIPLTPANELLVPGAKCADLGCGAGNLVVALARRFPGVRVEGFEISETAIIQATHNVRTSRLDNALIVDARNDALGDRAEQFDVVTTLDVLHDATDPADLIRQVFTALKPRGAWILGDIACRPTFRENVQRQPNAPFYFAVSTCLCLACGTSTPNGLGLGTLGFTVPLATAMLAEAGFGSVRVLLEEQNTRWFLAVKP